MMMFKIIFHHFFLKPRLYNGILIQITFKVVLLFSLYPKIFDEIWLYIRIIIINTKFLIALILIFQSLDCSFFPKNIIKILEDSLIISQSYTKFLNMSTNFI